jgi:hypothetical protein
MSHSQHRQRGQQRIESGSAFVGAASLMVAGVA